MIVDAAQCAGEAAMSELAFDQVRRLALQLPPAERVRLASWLAATVDSTPNDPAPSPARSLYGLWADLGAAPSESDIGAASFVETRYQHIVVDDEGVPRIVGTTMKVVELITAQSAYGWSPEELRFQFPYLSMSQIHSALAYYWDHQGELDQDIARRLAVVEHLRQQPSDLRARLRAQSGI